MDMYRDERVNRWFRWAWVFWVMLPLAEGIEAMDDFDVLKERLVTVHLESADSDDVDRTRSIFSDTGRFPDLGYDGYADYREHLLRLTSWVQAYRQTPESGLYKDISAATEWWLSEDYIDPNWWWTYIGFPELLAPVTALMGKAFREHDPAILQQLIHYYNRVYAYAQTTPHGGGANVADMSYYAMIGAAFAHNGKRMQQIVDKGFNPVVRWIGQDENVDGFRVDGTMLAHGPQLYNGTYGRELLNSVTRALVLLRQTEWELADEKVDIVEQQLLLGVEPMTYGNWFDYNATGRAVSRPTSASLGIGFIPILERMLELEVQHPQRLEDLLERLQTDQVTATNHYSGTRAFWTGEFLSHVREGYYTSVRLVSERTRRNEYLNNEGVKNRFFGDGIQFTLVHGDEYDELPPVWNFARLPGLTAPQLADLKPPVLLGEPGSVDYAGVLSSGTEGVAAMRVEMKGLDGWKSWFFIDEGVVALGSGLSATPDLADVPVQTTLNQKRAAGRVVWGKANQVINQQSTLPVAASLSGVGSWVWHRDTGYLVLDFDGSFRIEAEAREGNWADIGTADRAAQADVFTAFIDHGKQTEDAHYAYLNLPRVAPEGMPALAADPPVEILRQDDRVHAVRHRNSGQLYMAFLQAGSLNLSEDRILHLDQPCLVLLVQESGSAVMYLSDPRLAADQVTYRFEDRNGNETPSIRGTIDLPSGDRRGDTVRIPLDMAFDELR